MALLGAGYLILIARLTSFPFEDLPDHLARAKVLGDLLFHHGAQWGSVFAFHFRPVPYLLYDLILTSLVAAFGTAAGGAVFNELVLLSLRRPLRASHDGAARLLHALAGAPALAAAVVLAAINLAYVGWHLEKDNAWVEGYRTMVAQLSRGARVLPIYTYPKVTMPLEHSSAYVVLDRGGLIPYLLAGNRGDPMSYFKFNQRPYAPLEQWYHLQEMWNRSPLFTFKDQGQTYRWRFRYDVREGDWKPAVLAPVSWSQVACEYPYIIISQPYEPSSIGVPTRPLAANSSAALLTVDRSACRPAANGSAGTLAPPPQVTY